jgi:hypothetical protein
MIPTLFPASETSEFSGVSSLETPPRHEQRKQAEPATSLAAGEAFFMPEEEEYFSFEI